MIADKIAKEGGLDQLSPEVEWSIVRRELKTVYISLLKKEKIGTFFHFGAFTGTNTGNLKEIFHDRIK